MNVDSLAEVDRSNWGW